MSLEEQQIRTETMKLMKRSVCGGTLLLRGDGTWNIVEADQSFLDCLKYDDMSALKAESRGSFLGLLLESDVSKVQQMTWEEEGKGFCQSFMLRKGDGLYLPMTCTASSVLYADDQRGVLIWCMDSTDTYMHAAHAEKISRRLRLALEQTGACIWEFDLKKKCCYLPKKSGEHDIEETEIQNVPKRQIQLGIIHPKDEKRYLAIYDALYRGEEEVCGDIRIKYSGDKYRWLRIKYVRERDQDGLSDIAVGVSEDITDQRRLEQKYKEEMQRRKATDEGVYAFCRMNLTRDVIEEMHGKNNHYGKFGVGDKASDLLSFSVESYAKNIPESLTSVERMIQAADAGQMRHSFERICTGEDGVIRWISVSCHLMIKPVSGEKLAFFYTKDITKERMIGGMVSALIQMDYDYVGYFHSTADYYVSYTGNAWGEMVQNVECKEFRKLSRAYTMERIIKEDRERCLEALDVDYVVQQLEKMPVYSVVFGMVDHEGNIRRKRIEYSRLMKGQPLIAMNRVDVTALYEEEIRKNDMLKDALLGAQQASNAKSRFLSRMSHEMRTPLNAIVGMSTLGAEDEACSDQAREYLLKTKAAAEYLTALVEDILDVSKFEACGLILKKTDFTLEQLHRNIEDIISPQAKKQGIILHMSLPDRLGTVYSGDRIKLQQVLVNLLSNAVKFTPSGNTVGYAVHIEQDTQEKSIVKFQVVDTGMGISEEFLPHIFEPFTQEESGNTSPYGGSGLGLSISKNIVETMNGTLEIQSIKGKGTMATVRVPLMKGEGAVSQPKIPDASNGVSLAGRRILLVEDHPLNIEIAMRILQKNQVTVDIATDGEQGIKQYVSQPPGTYDCILMDIRMPVMDGLQATRKIRSMGLPDSKKVPIVAMTANSLEEDVEKSCLCGMNGHLSKPIQIQTMQETLRQVIGEYRGER